jgi:hypothetical protein
MQKLHNSDDQASELEKTLAQIVGFSDCVPILVFHTNARHVPPRTQLGIEKGIRNWELGFGNWELSLRVVVQSECVCFPHPLSR